MNKRGLSPVIATVLLVSIALILAVIIFLWARNFLAEKTQKNDKPIEMVCDDISFDAEASGSASEGVKLDVVNRGSVPLYGIEVRKKDTGSITGIGVFRGTINIGETQTDVDIDYTPSGSETLIVYPMILGQAGNVQKRYTCDTKPVEISV